MIMDDNIFGVSVCITAYNSTRFIKECLDSVARQSWFKEHDNYEILVGVDGDQETLLYLQSIMSQYKNLRVLMMDSNEGTYITTNTLFDVAKYDYVVRFDADDIMSENCIKEVISKMRGFDFIRFKFHNFYETESIRWHDILVAHGIGMFRKDKIKEFGYFRPWRIAADTEFLHRLKNYIRIGATENVVFERRVYDGSLTTAEKTKQKSQLRNYYAYVIKNARYTSGTTAIIPAVTNTYKEVFVQ